MQSRIKYLWEFIQEPCAWTHANFIVGVVILLIANKDDESAMAFALAWYLSALIAALPGLFSSSWRFGSQSFIKSDRALAYMAGWRCHQALMESCVEEVAADSEEERLRLAEEARQIFSRGLREVEAGKHLPGR